ncbi:MAG: hypothetical protein U1E17_09750 [Geminicoccaceae bacterium]
MVHKDFSGAEDACQACELHATVEADEADGRCLVCLTGAGDIAAEPLWLKPDLVPVARKLVADGLADLAGLLARWREGSVELLHAAGELQLWARSEDNRRVLALTCGAGAVCVATATAHELYRLLARVERYLRGNGLLAATPAAG